MRRMGRRLKTSSHFLFRANQEWAGRGPLPKFLNGARASLFESAGPPVNEMKRCRKSRPARQRGLRRRKGFSSQETTKLARPAFPCIDSVLVQLRCQRSSINRAPCAPSATVPAEDTTLAAMAAASAAGSRFEFLRRVDAGSPALRHHGFRPIR